MKEYGTVVEFVARGGGSVAGAKGFAIARHAGGAARGDTVTCRVLGVDATKVRSSFSFVCSLFLLFAHLFFCFSFYSFVDATKRVVDVSLLPALVATAAELAEIAAAEAPKKKKRKSPKAKAKAASAAGALPKPNTRVKAAVEFVRASAYAVISLAKNPGVVIDRRMLREILFDRK